MSASQKITPNLTFYPLTSDRWADLERLFGKNGACGGCWCMDWRLERSEFNRLKGEGNRRAFKRLVESGRIPGILAYEKDKPVGWCSVEPREKFSRLKRSRILKQVDEKPVWSVNCFFVDKSLRGRWVSSMLLKAAVEYVKRQGGKIVEGYPVEPSRDRIPAAFGYTGLASAFLKAGFVEVARRSKTRPIMRYIIKKD